MIRGFSTPAPTPASCDVLSAFIALEIKICDCRKKIVNLRHETGDHYLPKITLFIAFRAMSCSGGIVRDAFVLDK